METALIIPLVLLMTFGVMEYGWVFLKAQELTNATRNGARLAVTPDAVSGEPEALVAAYLAQAGIAGATVSVTPGPIEDLDPGTAVTVTAVVTYDSLLDMAFIPTPSQLRARVSMSKEGP